MWGLDFKVQGSGFRVWGSRFFWLCCGVYYFKVGVLCGGSEVERLGFRVWGIGFRVQGSGF
jgi:hypothetical protein